MKIENKRPVAQVANEQAAPRPQSANADSATAPSHYSARERLNFELAARGTSFNEAVRQLHDGLRATARQETSLALEQRVAELLRALVTDDGPLEPTLAALR